MQSCLTDTSVQKQLQQDQIHNHIINIENQNLRLVDVLNKVKHTTNGIKLSHEYIKPLMNRKGQLNPNFNEYDDVDMIRDMANMDDEQKAQMIQQQMMIEGMASDKNERATN